MNSQMAHSGRSRVVILLLAVAGFFVQTGFVYFDFPRNVPGRRLSTQAKEGRDLWRKNNCQACHQIYGYGGFLGPDLTNITARRPDEDWTNVLTQERKQMPAFGFDEEECAAIVEFLEEISETGTGLPRFTTLKDNVDPDFLVGNYLRATQRTVDASVLRGEKQIRESACSQCHPPFSVGTDGAPDMTLALSRRSPEYIRTITREGKGAMPPHDFLTDEQVDDILTCLVWMNRNRRELGLFYSNKENGSTFNWATLPWFEY